METEGQEMSISQASPLNRVTPLSKYLAMVLFVLIPFVGGWIGYTHAPEKIVEVEKVVPSDKTDKLKNSTAVTDTTKIELVRTVEVQGTITGEYRDINHIQILSNGELAYQKSDFSNIKDTYVIEDEDIKELFFVGKTEIPNKDVLTPLKEIGGKLTYLVDSGSYSESTLIHGEDRKAPVSYFAEFEEIGGKLAYIYHKPDEQFETLVYDDQVITTADNDFSLLKEVGGKLAYIKGSMVPPDYKETLFYDGQEIKTSGRPTDIEMVAGKLAYVVRDEARKTEVQFSNGEEIKVRDITQGKDVLFYDGNQIDTADSIRGLANVNEKLVYKRQDGKNFPELVVDGKRITVPGEIQMVKAIGDKLAYTYWSATPDKQSVQSNLVLDGVEVAFATSALGWARFVGEMITDVQDVGGKLTYTVEGTESEDSLYYDGKKVLTAEIIGNSYQTIGDGGEYYIPRVTNSTPFYFYGANEKEGVTTFSIYRIAPK